MKLAFARRHLSIAAFPDIELPPLAIIVGINGSGKTHLLQAIENGSVANTTAPRGMDTAGRSDVKLLTASVPALQFTEYHSPAAQGAAAQNSGMGARYTYESARRQALSIPTSSLDHETGGALSRNFRSDEDPWRLGAAEVVRRTGANAAKVEEWFAFATERLVQPVPGANYHDQNQISQQYPFIGLVARRAGVTPLEVTEDQVRHYGTWSTDQFQSNLTMLLGRYRDAILRNRMLRYEDEAKGTHKALTDESLMAVLGSPPWEQLSETFASFGLPYVCEAPELFDYTQVQFILRREPGGQEVNPANLSSGERVLLQFAISSFQYDEELVNVTRPKLLLLDELDAPLHPEMVHRWLGVIADTLVAEQGMHCILTTHSPTTVALAPEAALYEMRDGYSGLASISKQDALNKLTFGVPTLSINYTGRRQVFTESDTDAAIFERIYSLVKSYVACERELNFLSTGMRGKDNGELNSGSTIVKATVKRLAELGNLSVFGIIDWDGKAESSDRIRVVAEGRRDGIENVMLDPLLVCLLLVKQRKTPEGLGDIDRFISAGGLQRENLQRLVDAVQRPLFPYATEVVEVEYLGGARANVLRAYLEEDDHALEDALCSKFQVLDQWHRGKKGHGTLVKIVVEHVLAEHTYFCPSEIRTVFETIANAPT